MKKITLFWVLLIGFSVGSFAESFYSISTGLFRSNEQYYDDHYGREQEGVNFLIGINYYPAESPFGWFITGSADISTYGFEWTEDSMWSMDIYSTTDLRLGGGPSYKIISGQTFVFPVSLGPVISNYREEDSYYYYYDYGDYNMIFYESLSIGLLADASVFLIPFKWFTIKTGISVAWDFLRFERGNMQRNSGSTHGGQLKYVNYMAFKVNIYSGIGVRF